MDSASQFTITFGTLFSLNLDRSLSVYAAAGPEIASFSASYTPFNGSTVYIESLSAGLAADVGLSLKLNSYAYFTLGSVFSYNFWLLNAQDDETASSYSLSSVRPYAAFAFSFE